MTAFDDITAEDFDDATFDDFVRVNRAALTETWFNDNGELNPDAVRRLQEHASRWVTSSDGRLKIIAVNTLSELAKGLTTLSSPDNRERVLQLRGSHAIALLDIIQTWLDLEDPEHPARRRLLYLLIKLAAASQQLPTNIFLQGVDLGEARDPWRTGGFADIFRGTYRNRAVVGKRLRLHNLDKKAVHTALCRESLVWHQLKHPSIMPLLGVDATTFASSGSLCLVSPLMKCSLAEHVRSSDYVPRRDLFRLLLMIASGLAYLHSLKVVHGDINLANILLTEDGFAQLADFGLAVVGDGTVGNMTTKSGEQGTLRWMSPERLQGLTQRLQPTDDVYAFACLCYALFSRKVPFYDVVDYAVPFKVITGIRPAREDCEDCPGVPMTDKTWDMIDSCWRSDPASRPSMVDADRRLVELSQFGSHTTHTTRDGAPTSRPSYSDVWETNTASSPPSSPEIVSGTEEWTSSTLPPTEYEPAGPVTHVRPLDPGEFWPAYEGFCEAADVRYDQSLLTLGHGRHLDLHKLHVKVLTTGGPRYLDPVYWGDMALWVGVADLNIPLEDIYRTCLEKFDSEYIKLEMYRRTIMLDNSSHYV